MSEIEMLLEKINNMISSYSKDDSEYLKYKIIEKILKTPRSFLGIPIDDAFNMLKDLGVEDVKETYFKIINQY